MRKIVLAFVFVALAGVVAVAAPSYPSTPSHFRAQVIRVIDGDTYDVFVERGLGDFTIARVRLMGIDCPEVRTRSAEEKIAGKKATAFVELRLIDPDGAVHLVHLNDWRIRIQVWKTDSFGRWLANVRYAVPGAVSEDLGTELVKAGLCKKGGRR